MLSPRSVMGATSGIRSLVETQDCMFYLTGFPANVKIVAPRGLDHWSRKG